MHLPTQPRDTLNDRFIVAALLVVGALIFGAMGGLWRYSSTPGAGSTVPSAWPRHAGLPLRDGLTLLMFADPTSASTGPSLTELRELVAAGGIRAVVLFALPDGLVDDRPTGPAWELAAGIPGVAALPDPGEHEARLFGAAHSGQVVVYDSGGRLVFDGDIARARGQLFRASEIRREP